MRVDAQRNRDRILVTATELFRERGLEVSVGEVAEAADVGRATLFRNFPTKEDLIAAVVARMMTEAIEEARTLLSEDQDPAEAVFTFLSDTVGYQQANRALLEGVGEDLHGHVEFCRVHDELLEVIGALLDKGKRAGSVRPDIAPFDVVMLIKGVCMSAPLVETESPAAVARYLELVRAAIATPEYVRPSVTSGALAPIAVRAS